MASDDLKPWLVWLLDHLPRSIVVLILAMVTVVAILVGLALVVCGLIFAVKFPIPGIIIGVIAIILYVGAIIYQDIDSDLPKREKKQ